MEYIERGSLRPYVGRMTMAQIGGVLEGLLAGLTHAETHDIVHRDLKPENLMVTADGRVKIADFGIAKATTRMQTGAFLTATGTTVGTPTYMAPEQAMAQDIGPWTDLYSVGCMAFEMFTGNVPFHDSEAPMAILLRHVNEPIAAVKSIRPEVDQRISDWVERLLVKEPEARTQNAQDAWDDFEEILLSLLGPRWRREARLVEARTDTNGSGAKPLTPAPFQGTNVGDVASEEFKSFAWGAPTDTGGSPAAPPMWTPPPSEATPAIPEPIVGPPTPMPSQAIPAAGPRPRCRSTRSRSRPASPASSPSACPPRRRRATRCSTPVPRARAGRSEPTPEPVGPGVVRDLRRAAAVAAADERAARRSRRRPSRPSRRPRPWPFTPPPAEPVPRRAEPATRAPEFVPATMMPSKVAPPPKAPKPPKPEKSGESSRPGWLIPAIAGGAALVLLIIILALVLGGGGGGGEKPVATTTADAEADRGRAAPTSRPPASRCRSRPAGRTARSGGDPRLRRRRGDDGRPEGRHDRLRPRRQERRQPDPAGRRPARRHAGHGRARKADVGDGTQALRYDKLPVGEGQTATVFAVPTSKGVATLACVAEDDTCDEIASSMRITDGDAFPVGPSDEYAGKLRVGADQAREVREVGGHRPPQRQQARHAGQRDRAPGGRLRRRGEHARPRSKVSPADAALNAATLAGAARRARRLQEGRVRGQGQGPQRLPRPERARPWPRARTSRPRWPPTRPRATRSRRRSSSAAAKVTQLPTLKKDPAKKKKAVSSGGGGGGAP